MQTQTAPNDTLVILTRQGELELKQERCNERRLAASEWFNKWLAIVNRVEPVEEKVS